MLRSAKRKLLPVLPEWRLVERLCAYVDHIVHQREWPLGEPYRSFSRYLTHLRTSRELEDPLRRFITDKEYAKLYVKAVVGEEFNVPTLLVAKSADEASEFRSTVSTVAKPTHVSGQVKFLAPGKQLPRRVAEAWLSLDFYRISREANYRCLRPKIILEELLEESGKPADDYKVYCFHGQPKFIRVSIDRFGAYTAAIYDPEWNRLGFTIKHSQGPDVLRPPGLEEMCQVASKLAEPFDMLRVDLYYFGAVCMSGN